MSIGNSFLLCILYSLVATVPSIAVPREETYLAPPPTWQNVAQTLPFSDRPRSRMGGLMVNAQSRSDVVNFFNTVHSPAFTVPIDWTGNVAGCVAGVTSSVYLNATLQIVNYFRAMSGLPGDVANISALTLDAQDAALMMIAEGNLSHAPPPNWACFSSTGATSAGSANLALGNAGPNAMVAYMRDSGTFNTEVGHRRWILYPPQMGMGSGSNDGVNGFFVGANTLDVLSTFGTRPAVPNVVAWPPPGFVPYPVVYPRWSMSLNNVPEADYTNATVTMTLNGVNVPLNIIARFGNFGDSTLVWEPTGLTIGAGLDDQTFSVTVANIGGSAAINYAVTIIDPVLTSDELFSDGFESGDTGIWNGVVP